MSHARPTVSLCARSYVRMRASFPPRRSIRTPGRSSGAAQQYASASSYAKVHHRKEYEEAMDGRHGQQLELAWKEGSMKSDRSQYFDPFEYYKVLPTQEGEHGSMEDIVTDNDNDNDNVDDTDVPLNESDMDHGEDLEEENASNVPILKETMKRYNRDGSLILPPATRAAYAAGAAAGGSFAIVTLANSPIQHKVSIDDVIISNKLKPVHQWSVGTVHTLSSENGNSNGNVLLVGSCDATLVGLPYVQGAEVDVMVEEITRDQTVLVFQKKRRKNHRRKNGFRRQVTFLRVLDIRVPLEENAYGQGPGEDLVA